MKKIILIGIVFAVFLSGCLFPAEKKGEVEEAVLEMFEGLGVLAFDPQFKEVTSGSQFYVALVLRNNALGEDAKNIYVGLENVEPFKVLDCKGNKRRSDELRLNLTDSKCYFPTGEETTLEHCCYLDGINITLDMCCLKQRGDEISHLYDPEFDLDAYLTYKQHGMTKMYSGGERVFYWLIESPVSPKIADISYEHYFYYFINYDYFVTAAYPVTILSQEEETRLRMEGETAPTLLPSTSSGDIKIDFSKTQNPQLYLKYGTTKYTLLFYYSNLGKGVPVGTTNLVINLPKNASDYPLVEIPNEARRLGWECGELKCELDIETNQILDNTIFELPFTLRHEELGRLRRNNLPYETYIFFFNASYTYSLDGKTFIKVKSPLI